MLNSRHIEIFYSVYKYKTLTNAAKILNVSQPALSKALQYAELKLNLKLFSKSSGLLVPTPEADKLFKHAEKINASVKEFNKIAENLSDLPSDFIDIGVTPSLGGSFLPDLIADFNKLKPEIKFNIHNSQSYELLEKLHDFSHDIVICYNPPKLNQYQEIILKESEMVFVTSSMNEKFKGMTEVHIKNIKEEPLIKIANILSGFDQEDKSDDYSLEAHLLDRNINPRWVAITETFHVAKKLVEKGLGSSIIDNITSATGENSNLRILKLKPSIKFKISCLINPDKRKSIAARKFFEFIDLKRHEFMTNT